MFVCLKTEAMGCGQRGEFCLMWVEWYRIWKMKRSDEHEEKRESTERPTERKNNQPQPNQAESVMLPEYHCHRNLKQYRKKQLFILAETTAAMRKAQVFFGKKTFHHLVESWRLKCLWGLLRSAFFPFKNFAQNF